MKYFKKAIVLSPHTDDGEIGAGGLINKLIKNNTEVIYVAFSICEESVPDNLEPTILSKEVLLATKELGLVPENVLVYRKKVRYFDSIRQEILEILVKLNKEIKPDLVLLPSKDDIHQDHQVIHNEGVRAFKNSTLLGYETPWNNFGFEATLLVKLDIENIKAKINAVSKYKSQTFRSYDLSKLKSIAEMRGLQVKTKYAEAFNIVRWIWD